MEAYIPENTVKAGLYAVRAFARFTIDSNFKDRYFNTDPALRSVKKHGLFMLQVIGKNSLQKIIPNLCDCSRRGWHCREPVCYHALASWYNDPSSDRGWTC
eukprot:IDg22288t1